MNQQNTINPDHVIQQAVQCKLNVYSSKETFESILKAYNDAVDGLISLVNLMKQRIIQLEAEAERAKIEKVTPKEEKVKAGK